MSSAQHIAPIVLGIAGGTGSGKSTVADKLVNAVGVQHIAYLDQDSYYRDQSDLPYEERRRTNFDHPDAIEFSLLAEHIDKLRQNESIHKPHYSFTESVRLREWTLVPPAPIVIVEGILILTAEEIRQRLDMKLFVDADDDIRLIRRITRDIEERGRTFRSVVEQYRKTVRPMHLTFVEPSKRYADVIIPRGGKNDIAIRMVTAMLRERCAEHTARVAYANGEVDE